MDKLEDFIRNHRGEMDQLDPSPVSWMKIRKKTGRKPSRTFFMYAAAATIALLAGFGVYNYFYGNGKPQDSNTNASYRNQLKEARQFYNSEYLTRYLEAKPLLEEQPAIDRELRSGSAQIDSICNDLMKDLKDNVSNKEVIEALIRNYRIKVRLLEDMLDIARQNQQDSTENLKYRKNHEI